MDVRIALRNLADEAAALHAKERKIVFESILLVGQLDSRNAAVNMHMSTEAFAARIGLTIDQWYKRCRAARLVMRFPQVRAALESGEIKASHVEMMYPVITAANQHVIVEGARGKGRREVEAFLRRVTSEGALRPESEVEIEMKVKLTAEEAALLDRAREILAAAGSVPAAKDVLVKALKELVERRDPLKKAERAAARAEKVDAARHIAQGGAPEVGPAARQSDSRYVPAAVRHAVRLRDGAQCTWRHADGSRCAERMMLEFDHLRMFCRGGQHRADQLTLRCRYHNRVSAEQELGQASMSPYRVPARWRGSEDGAIVPQ